VNDRLHLALVIFAALCIGAVGVLLTLPWFLRRRWSTTRPSMWERRGGS